MARSDRHNRNLAKVQAMVDGTFRTHKIQVGTHTAENVHANRKVGERYFDHDGKEWEKTDWGRSSIKAVHVGLGDNCSDCDKLIIKKFDKDTHIRMGRCYNCQVHFEEELKWNKNNKIGKSGNKWQFWVKLQQLRRWDSIDRDMEQIVEENYKESQKKVWDKSVSNAMSNANIEMSIKQNKS